MALASLMLAREQPSCTDMKCATICLMLIRCFVALALSTRVVSPINRRVIMNMIDPRRPADSALLAFQRGEQRVEMAARARGGQGVQLLPSHTISRAKFNVDLLRFDHAELASAADRIARASVESGAMPPTDVRQLDPAMRQRLIDYLEAGDFSKADLDMLAHAARAGMAGDAQ